MLPWERTYLCALDAATGKPTGKGRFVRIYETFALEGAFAATADRLFMPQGRSAGAIFDRNSGKDVGHFGRGGSFVALSVGGKHVIGGPGTRRPGDTILIPQRQAKQPTGLVPNDAYLSPADILYGVDLALDKKLAEEGIFEILVDDLHGSLDAALVRGLDNVVQGVQIILGTEKNTTTFADDIGIRRASGKKGTLDVLLTSSINLREAILSDPRVRGIESMATVLEGDVLSQEITPVLLNERDGVTIVTPFGSASGAS